MFYKSILVTYNYYWYLIGASLSKSHIDGKYDVANVYVWYVCQCHDYEQ